MCSATGTEGTFPPRCLIFSIFFLLFLASLPLAAQQDSVQQVPFKIRRAGEFLQRRDSTGAQIFILRDAVLISHEQSTISCNLLIFFLDSGYVRCTESVHVADTVRTLLADTLYYYVDSAYYQARGNLRWSSEKIRGSGDVGEYWRDRDLFKVTGNAWAADSSREVRSYSMEYDYTSDVLLADGDVRFTDGETGSEATAAGAMYRSGEKLLVLRGRPVLTYYEDTDSLHKDPFRLTGDVVTGYGSDSLAASGRVRLWQDGLTVTADSLFHDRRGEKSYFRGGPPQVEHPDYRLSSATLDVTSSQRELRLIEAAGDGRGEFWSERRDSLLAEDGQQYVSWIEGDSLNLFFSGGAMDSIYAAGSARSYYHENRDSGVNYVQGGMILLVFKNNKLEVVEVGQGGSGVYLPPDSGGTITVIPDSAGFKTVPDSILRR